MRYTESHSFKKTIDSPPNIDAPIISKTNNDTSNKKMSDNTVYDYQINFQDVRK